MRPELLPEPNPSWLRLGFIVCVGVETRAFVEAGRASSIKKRGQVQAVIDGVVGLVVPISILNLGLVKG